MACVINYNNKTYSLEDFKNILLKDLSLVKEVANKSQERLKAIQEVFNSNPELSKVGDVFSYAIYLDTIFPDSQVKDIVYHGTNKKFDRFDKNFINKSFENLIFFFKNRKNAEEWSEKSELNLKKDDLINDIIKLNTSMKEASVEDNILYALTQHFTLDNKEDLNNKHKDTFNKITTLLNYLNLDIDNLYNLINSNLEIYRSTIRNSIDNSPSEKIINNNRVISVVVNSQNPLILQDSYHYYLGKESGKKFTRDVNNNIENYDSLIAKDVTEYENDSIKNRDTQYAVKEPEQIHILGSQQDIQGVQDYIHNDNSNSLSKDNLIEQEIQKLKEEGLLEVSCKYKAEHGLRTTFQKGGTWEIIKELKGNTHEEGGIDIVIGKEGVRIKRGDSELKAEYGLVIPKN